MFARVLIVGALGAVASCAGSEPATELNFDAEWQRALESLPPEILNDPQLTALPSPAVRSLTLHTSSSSEEEDEEIAERITLREDRGGLSVVDKTRSYYSLSKNAGPGGSDVVYSVGYGETTLTAYGGLIDLVTFRTRNSDGKRDDSLTYLTDVDEINGTLFPLSRGKFMHISADLVSRGADTKVYPASLMLYVEKKVPASQINPHLKGAAWVISEEIEIQVGKEWEDQLAGGRVFAEELGYAFPLGSGLDLVGFDDGGRQVGPSYAAIAHGHAEAGLASQRQHAAAMASALQQLGQASAGLAATLAGTNRVVPPPSFPTNPGVSSGHLPQLAAGTSGTGAGSSAGATPTPGGFNLNEQIFQQRCVQATPSDQGEARACQALAQSLGRSYPPAEVAGPGGRKFDQVPGDCSPMDEVQRAVVNYSASPWDAIPASKNARFILVGPDGGQGVCRFQALGPVIEESAPSYMGMDCDAGKSVTYRLCTTSTGNPSGACQNPAPAGGYVLHGEALAANDGSRDTWDLLGCTATGRDNCATAPAGAVGANQGQIQVATLTLTRPAPTQHCSGLPSFRSQ